MSFHQNYRRISFAVVLLLAVVITTGYAGTKAEANPLADTTLKQFLQQYETTFDPSAYQIPITISRPKSDSLSLGVAVRPPDTTSHDSLEYTSGFRVQLMTTQEIDQANRLKDTIEIAFGLGASSI